MTSKQMSFVARLRMRCSLECDAGHDRIHLAGIQNPCEPILSAAARCCALQVFEFCAASVKDIERAQCLMPLSTYNVCQRMRRKVDRVHRANVHQADDPVLSATARSGFVQFCEFVTFGNEGVENIEHLMPLGPF